MVKRTTLVLGIFSLVLAMTGMSFGFVGAWSASSDCGVKAPLYVPAECPPYPLHKTIVKTWSCKIVGPCPAPGPVACGDGGFGKGVMPGGVVTSLANMLGAPLDLLFNHCDSVYGCTPNFGGGDGACGPCFGPIPRALVSVPLVLGAPTTLLGTLW